MKKTGRILLIITILLAITYFFLPGYVQTALIYQNVDIDDYTIFHNRTIKAGTAEPWKLSKDYNKYQFSAKDRAKIEAYKPVAFLVIQDQKILYEEYWEDYSPSSLSNSFSASKSIVSLLVGIAIDDGYIKSIDQKVKDFIPKYDSPENKNLSIRDLLTMSSGLNWDEAYTSPFSKTTEAYYGTDLSGMIKSLKVVDEPGKQYNYLSGNAEVLAMILQAATGQTISSYASEKIWTKIGAEHDALWSLDRENGLEKAYCCYYSNARDFARFGQLILNNGQWDSTQIISASYLKDAISPASYLLNEEGTAPVDYYGYQFWIIDYKGMKIPYMRGILGQYIYAIKEKNAVVIRLGHKRSHEYVNHHTKDIYLYLDEAMKILK
jgi:CubicO group peptidase (beta-lactamase class C family)